MRLKVLDLFCGAGGAAIGLKRSGAWSVYGIDIEDQPNYPFDFWQGDALSIDPKWVRKSFDFVWASPPCQAHTALKHAPNSKEHDDLIPETRELLKETGLPYCIENVEGAPLVNPVTLCGSHFGLGAEGYHLRRHRLFECSFDVRQPKCDHKSPVIGIYGGHVRCRSKKHGGRGTKDFGGFDKPSLAASALDVRNMTMYEMSQAIPPAYSRYIVSEYRRSLRG